MGGRTPTHTPFFGYPFSNVILPKKLPNAFVIVYNADTLTNEPNSRIKKYAFIDALRGWAILAVVFFHTAVVVAPGSNLLTMVKEQGARGVQLFYIASALTIFLSMRGRAGEEDATRKFFIRRFFRIAPLFYLAMIAYLIGYGFGPRAGAPYGLNGWHILWTATFLNGWHPEMINSVVPVGWSIAVEMTFYLFAPLLFARIKNIRHALLLVLVALLLMKLLRDLLFPPLSALYPEHQYFVRLYFYLWFFAQLPVFALGILVYQAFLKTAEKPDRPLGWTLLFVAIFLFVAFLNVSTYANLLPVHILYGIAFGMFTLALAYHPIKLLVNPLTVWIGKLSYSVYLVHYGIAVLLWNFLGDKIPAGDVNYFLVFVLLTAITLPVSWLTYTLVEKPGIRLGKRIIQRMEGRKVAYASD